MSTKLSRAEWDQHSGFCPMLHDQTSCQCAFIRAVKASERDRILGHLITLADELLSLPEEMVTQRYAWGRLDQLIRLLDEAL